VGAVPGADKIGADVARGVETHLTVALEAGCSGVISAGTGVSPGSGATNRVSPGRPTDMLSVAVEDGVGVGVGCGVSVGNGGSR
jgi:hypothetical protein